MEPSRAFSHSGIQCVSLSMIPLGMLPLVVGISCCTQELSEGGDEFIQKSPKNVMHRTAHVSYRHYSCVGMATTMQGGTWLLPCTCTIHNQIIFKFTSSFVFAYVNEAGV